MKFACRSHVCFALVCKQVLIVGLCSRLWVDKLQLRNGARVSGKKQAREIAYINTQKGGVQIALGSIFWGCTNIILCP